jgi:alkanesulfonate monooxygenase SsuD/methylene tetrahydromethanopterin reductase-like flavin-dependent oxidoreductase (luciferase family)
MSTHRPLGAAVVPLENRLAAILSAMTTAERLGYDAFFQNETWAFDATLLLAEAAARTTNLGLATAILGVWNRSAATIAMAASTLAALSGGRFALGLGASTQQLTEGLHDVPFAAPIERMRRTVTQVRALLRGERIPLAAVNGARPLKLNCPRQEIPIYLAGLADESIRLAGEVADGWLPFLYPRDRLVEGKRLLREGATRTGDPGRRIVVHPAIPTVVSNDPAKAREGAAWFVAFYVTSMGALYRQSLARHGFAGEVTAVLAANTPKRLGVVPSEAEALLEQLTVWGTPAQARARLERWYDAGADMPIVFIRENLNAQQVEYTLAALRPTGQAAAGRHAMVSGRSS